ncbi:MAG: desulfoferrodoxin family protein [Oscillospiraceae bacterium]
MTESQKFFICKKCGNLVGMVHYSGAPLSCCGAYMQELAPNTSTASAEKHLPVITSSNGRVLVEVGSIPHPMTEEHLIEWIYLQTRSGGQRKRLLPGEKPRAVFVVEGDEPIAAFAYCNLHGLWGVSIL